MNKNEIHRAKIKAIKQKEDEEFLKTIPFSEPIFRELFDFLNLELEVKSCKRNFELTEVFLSSKGINFKEHINFFLEHGGGCDCEIILNVEGVFPEPECTNHTKTKPKIKREKVNSLNFKNLKVDSIPSPWRLFKAGNDYEFQLGKKQNIKVKLIKEFKVKNWKNSHQWQNQWESITELKVRGNKEVIYDNIEGFNRVLFKTENWSPVINWLKKSENESWGLIFKTELSRLQGDINELKKLLKSIKITTANNV